MRIEKEEQPALAKRDAEHVTLQAAGDCRDITGPSRRGVGHTEGPRDGGGNGIYRYGLL